VKVDRTNHGGNASKSRAGLLNVARAHIPYLLVYTWSTSASTAGSESSLSQTMANPEKTAPNVEEDYASSEDEDFNPITAEVREEDISSSSDDEDTNDTKTKIRKVPKKRKQTDEDDLDSGDEATIKESRRKKKRKEDADEDSGGEGGLVKTRAQRAAEYVLYARIAMLARADALQEAGATRIS